VTLFGAAAAGVVVAAGSAVAPPPAAAAVATAPPLAESPVLAPQAASHIDAPSASQILVVIGIPPVACGPSRIPNGWASRVRRSGFFPYSRY
jgi:hypothetical protein